MLIFSPLFQFSLYVLPKTSTPHGILIGIAFTLKISLGASLVVQWVRLWAPSAGGLGSIPGQGTRSCVHAATKSSHASISPHTATKEVLMPQLRGHTSQLKKDPTCCNEDPACCN